MKHFIFDFDGTLVQSRPLAVRLFNELAERHGYMTMKEEEVEYYSTLSIRDRARALKLPLYKVPQVAVEIKRQYKQAITELRMVEGMREALLALKQEGASLGILSSNTEENIRQYLVGNGVEVFDYIHSATNLFGKDKAIVSYLRKHGLSAADVLYVGDEIRDIEACKKAGIRMAAVTWGYDAVSLMEPAGPDLILHAPHELLDAARNE